MHMFLDAGCLPILPAKARRMFLDLHTLRPDTKRAYAARLTGTAGAGSGGASLAGWSNRRPFSIQVCG